MESCVRTARREKKQHRDDPSAVRGARARRFRPNVELSERRDRPQPRFVGEVGFHERVEHALGAFGQARHRNGSRSVGQWREQPAAVSRRA
jgi:hypothetical protein